MTEADWLTGPDFAAHTRFAAERLSPRRQRLLAAAFCRAASHLFDHPTLNRAIDVIECYADGEGTAANLEEARQACRTVAQEEWEVYVRRVDAGEGTTMVDIWSEVAWAIAFAATTPLPLVEVGGRVASAVVQECTGTSLLAPIASPKFAAVTAQQSRVMRAVVWEIAGNLFRPVTFYPTWRTSTAVTLATQMYDRREFSAMPILADALQDAGCDAEDVLDHCRDAHAQHTRGCWVLDRVLGKE